jgi:hypothetical protein
MRDGGNLPTTNPSSSALFLIVAGLRENRCRLGGAIGIRTLCWRKENATARCQRRTVPGDNQRRETLNPKPRLARYTASSGRSYLALPMRSLIVG